MRNRYYFKPSRSVFAILTIIAMAPSLFGFDWSDAKKSAISGIISTGLVTTYDTVINSEIRSKDIFQEHLNANNPVQWAKRLNRPVNVDSVLERPEWLAAKRDISKIFGNGYLVKQEGLARQALAIGNKAGAMSNDIKGTVTEKLMDDFFKKDGWESIDGKRGRNGFDGLYVKRNSNGRISDWFAADAKTGNAKLQNTAYGMQLSKQWTKHNLELLVTNAKKEYLNTPTPELRQNINDLENMLKIPGRGSRIFSNKIINENGKTFLQTRIDQVIEINGRIQTTPSKPMLTNMQSETLTPTMNLTREMFYKHAKTEFINNGVPKAKAEAVLGDMRNAFVKGKITSDSDLYGFMQKKLPADKLKEISSNLGFAPHKTNIIGRLTYGTISSGLVASAISVTVDCFSGNLSSDSIKRSLFAAGTGSGLYIAQEGLKRGIETKVAQKALQYALGRSAALQMGKFGIPIFFSAATVVWTAHQWQQGNISTTDMAVYSGSSVASTAIFLFLTCTKAGALLGSAIPGGGTVLGVGIGVIIGIGVASYDYCQASAKLEARRKDDYIRATIDAIARKKDVEEKIALLEQKAISMRIEGWQILNNL